MSWLVDIEQEIEDTIPLSWIARCLSNDIDYYEIDHFTVIDLNRNWQAIS